MCQSEDGRCCTHKQRFVHLCGNIVFVAKHLCDNGNDNGHDEHADEDDSKDDGILTHGWLDTRHFTQSIYDNKFRHHKHKPTQKGQHTVQANKLLHPKGFVPQRFFSETIPPIFAPSFGTKALHQGLLHSTGFAPTFFSSSKLFNRRKHAPRGLYIQSLLCREFLTVLVCIERLHTNKSLRHEAFTPTSLLHPGVFPAPV